MTITKTHPTEQFPPQVTVADAPPHCPPWCDGEHSAQYASEFSLNKSAEDYAVNRAIFQEHRCSLPEQLSLPTLTWHLDPAEVLRPGGFSWELTVSSQVAYGQCWIEFSVSDDGPMSEGGTCPHVGTKLTSGEARTIAAQLNAAADVIERGHI